MHDIPFMVAIKHDIVPSIERTLSVHRFSDKCLDLTDKMAKGVESVTCVLVTASRIVTEKFQTDNQYAQDEGFETLKKLNGRLTRLRVEIQELEVILESSIAMLSSGVDKLWEHCEAHTESVDVMRKLNELIHDVKMFISIME